MNNLRDLLISDLKTVTARRSNFHGIDYISMPDLEDIINTRLDDYAKRFLDNLTDRFLCWKFPKDFSPDGGVSFTPLNNENCWPVGTNLLTADQAREMFEYLLDDTKKNIRGNKNE